MLYTVDIWGAPHAKVSTTGEVSHSYPQGILKLAHVQRQVTLQALGALYGTAIDILDAHANLLPFHLLLDKIISHAALCMAALPPSYPLHPIMRRSAHRFIKRHQTALHHMYKACDMDPVQIETVDPTQHCSPHLCSSIMVVIPETGSDTLAAAEQDKDDIKIFSDRSVVNGRVGGAAVLERNEQHKVVLCVHPGPSSRYTIFNRENVSLILTLTLALAAQRSQHVSVFIDSQSVLKALDAASAHPGHYLTDLVLQQFNCLLSH